MGEISLASSSLGVQPVERKKAVIRPKPIKAPILGMTIPARNAPNFCSFCATVVFSFMNTSI